MSANYQIEYKYNGIPNVHEFYLFVNPLGASCLHCEREINECIEWISSDVSIHILPYHNHKVISNYMEQLGLDPKDLIQRNGVYQTVYQAGLAFKAACMQGKKVGYRFLSHMQWSINGELHHFSPHFILALAEEVGLDGEMFMEDWQSNFVKELYLKDQRIANEMQISHTPSLVIYDHQFGDSGLLVDRQITQDTILAELYQIILDYHRNRCKGQAAKAKLTLITKESH